MTQPPEIPDDDVLQATGRTWREWFEVMHESGMRDHDREALIVFLREAHGVPAWWQRSIADAFEQSIGRRPVNETDDGFRLRETFELALPAGKVFAAWADDALRSKWLRRGDFETETVRQPGTVRGKWMPNGSLLDIEVTPVGGDRCSLAIVHRKLADDAHVERMRGFWKQSVERMVARIGEGG